MQVSRKEPGLIVSAAAHASLLAATLVVFSSPARFQDAQEAIPVEMMSDQAFSQISKGEKTAKEVRPIQKADKVADKTEQKPTPPQNEAKKDVPLPPPSLKRLPDPGEDDEPKKPEPQKLSALPPPRPPEETKPTPLPPERPPIAKAEPKDEPKEEPKEAEALTPKPPPRPKLEPKPEAKAESKPAPTPPKPPERPFNKDAIAQMLAKDKSTDKPVARPKSGEENDQPKSKFSTNDISKFLDHDKPQTTGSTGREVVRTASLGTATGTAARMSPSMMDALNSWMIEQYTRCWHYFGAGAGQKYIPQVRVSFRPDGSLAGEPTLVNPTSDPAFESLAKAAISATRECNPLRIPQQFSSYYDQWKSRTIVFDPEMMR